jgi:hypothetical protein
MTSFAQSPATRIDSTIGKTRPMFMAPNIMLTKI